MKKWLNKIGLMKFNYKDDLIPAGAGILFVIIASITWMIFIFNYIGNSMILERLIFFVTPKKVQE